MNTSRGFLHITYKLYGHLNKLGGEHKSHCLNVFLSVMKYAWKKNGYEARLRHETIHKDTGLCRTTIKNCLSTLNKLNVVKSFRGKSGKTYIVNEVFLKVEKLYENSKIDVKYTQDSRFTPILKEQYLIYITDKIIRDNRGNKDTIIDTLAKLPLTELNKDKNNPYYVSLAKKRKEEIAASENATYVSPNKIVSALNKIKKETNVRYRQKKEYNIRNGIKPWLKSET
jgi:predicted transcriptional regulator